MRTRGAPLIKDVAYEVLRQAGKPMHISEITDFVSKKVALRSKRPKNTVNSVLQRHDKVIRVGKGVFTITD